MSEHSSAHFLGEITRDRPKESQEREENSLLLLLCYVPEASHGCVMGVSEAYCLARARDFKSRNGFGW